uniref:Uncharacterized protein n=1 Tax=Ixodes ricinus TaxID=34613 RepID=A0A0K8RCU6_IXORI
MADSVAWSPGSRRPTNVYFFTCSSRASRLQAARKKYLEQTTTNKNAGSANTRDKLKRQRRLADRPSSHSAALLRRYLTKTVPTTGWRAEWNMPARPLWTLAVL